MLNNSNEIVLMKDIIWSWRLVCSGNIEIRKCEDLKWLSLFPGQINSRNNYDLIFPSSCINCYGCGQWKYRKLTWCDDRNLHKRTWFIHHIWLLVNTFFIRYKLSAPLPSLTQSSKSLIDVYFTSCSKFCSTFINEQFTKKLDFSLKQTVQQGYEYNR